MAKVISNTLTRWHKIAERMHQAAVEVDQEISQAVNPGAAVDFDTFEVRQNALTAAAEVALTSKTQLYHALEEALFDVRRVLAHANVKHGITDLLNAREAIKSKVLFYTKHIEAAQSAMPPEEFTALGLRRSIQPAQSQSDLTMMRLRGRDGNGSSRVTFMTAALLAEWTEKRDTLRRKQTNIADQLSDCNACRIEIEIEDRVAQALGL
jgi:hypothetical protein